MDSLNYRINNYRYSWKLDNRFLQDFYSNYFLSQRMFLDLLFPQC